MTHHQDSSTQWRFRAPLERSQPTLDELLWRAWPDSTQAQRQDLIERGKVLVDQTIAHNAKKVITPDAVIEFAPEKGAEVAGLPDAVELARGDSWIIVQKPTGMSSLHDTSDPMNSILFLADLLGLDRDTFTPAMYLPTMAGGPWLFGLTQDDAKQLTDAWGSGKMMLTFRAIVPRLDRPQGSLTGPGGLRVNYAVTRYQDGLCEVQLIPQYRAKSPQGHTFEPINLIRTTLAQQEIFILGDRLHGGYMIDGGLRLRLESILLDEVSLGHSWPMPDDWWPEEPVVDVQVTLEEEELDDGPIDLDKFDSDDNDRANTKTKDKKQNKSKTLDIPKLKVSDKTIEIMSQHKHPWVLADSQTGGRSHMKPGTVVALEGRRSRTRGPFALVEGDGELAARKWAEADDTSSVLEFNEEVIARLDEAIVKRAPLLKDMANTNIFRLVHAEADGLPGLCIDRIGDMIRATILGQSCRSFRKLVYDNLLDFDPHITLIEVWHTEDIRQRNDVLPKARIIHGVETEKTRTIGLEDGLKYWCEPWEGIDVGFFADQRENRRTLKQLIKPGDKWLNLFGHTGAFSVALASKGAQVVNVDVSKRYLDWTRENFLLNKIDPDLDVPAAMDARSYIREMSRDDLVDGIIVDPPTAAQGKAGFWSVRKDYAELLVQCFQQLKPGGTMLVCRNDRKAKGGLDKLITQAAQKAKTSIAQLVPAPPSLDYPRLEGFPEGDQFEGWMVYTK